MLSGEFLATFRVAERHLHVALTRTEPHIANEYVSEYDGTVFPANLKLLRLRTRVQRIEHRHPVPGGVGDTILGSSIESDCNFRTWIGGPQTGTERSSCSTILSVNTEAGTSLEHAFWAAMATSSDAMKTRRNGFN
jgi:hypothetical protein